MTIIVVGLVLSLAIIVSFFAIINSIMKSGLYDLIIDGLNILVDLFGTSRTITFLSLFTLGGVVLCTRFVMSWIGENPGNPANK